jgi:hypothetical protein
LLGYVRQGDLLDNDDDVDSSFCLSGSIEEVVDKQYNIASRLLEIRESYDIDLTISAPGQIVIWRGDSHIDIFTSWINTDGNFYSYFGVEGRLLKPKLQISQGKLLGRDIAAPEEAERILRMAYGPLWKTPDPTFQWVLSESLEKTMKLFKDAGERIFLERGLTA